MNLFRLGLGALLLALAVPGNRAGMAYSTPQETLASRTQQLLDRDTRLLGDMAAGRLDAILDPLFAGYHARVADFAAWAFQWRTSYALLRRGLFTLATLPFVDPPRAQRLTAAWDDMIVTKFEELVLRPTGGLSTLQSARDQWIAEVRPALDAVVTDTLLTAALLHGREPPQDIWTPVVEEHPPAADIPLLNAVAGTTGTVKSRMVRPLVTRFTIRPPVAAAVTAAGEALGAFGGLGQVAVLGNATQLVATVGTFLSIDYLLNRVDASMQQPALAAELHRILETEQAALRQLWLSAAQSEIDARLDRARLILDTQLLRETPVPTPAAIEMARRRRDQ